MSASNKALDLLHLTITDSVYIHNCPMNLYILIFSSGITLIGLDFSYL